MLLDNKRIVIFGGSGAIGSAMASVFAREGARLWLGGGAQTTMLGRLPTLEDVAETAAFLVSDKARAMTAAYVNLTAGMIPE